MEKIRIRTGHRSEMLDITGEVRKIVRDRKIKNGLAFVFCPHTTAAVTVNENCDPSVRSDINACLSRLIPAGAGYEHAEGNADAHVKAALVGSSRTLFIEDGDIAFGSWQGIFFCEFDGPRTREVWLEIINNGQKV
jgi:secondary thiamine-phosphate synthase enzyme